MSLNITHATDDSCVKFQVTGNSEGENIVIAVDNIEVEESSGILRVSD
jgi:hypothetical protein